MDQEDKFTPVMKTGDGGKKKLERRKRRRRKDREMWGTGRWRADFRNLLTKSYTN